MRLGEAVHGERLHGFRHALDDVRRDAVALHAGAQLHAHGVHFLLRTVEAQRAPQLLGLTAGEVRHDHRDFQKLLLEQRHAERAFEHGTQALVEKCHRLAPLPPREVRMQHVALDRAGADDGDLDDHVVKRARHHARQRGHLRTALDLEGADRVCAAEQVVGRRVVLRDFREVHGAAARLAKFNRVLHRGHHAEAEQVHLDDAEIRAVVLVPLRDDAPRHRGIFERHDAAELSLADDHPAAVLTEVARKAVDFLIERDRRSRARMPARDASIRELRIETHRVRKVAAAEKPRETIQHFRREIKRLSDLAHRAASAKGDHVCRHRRAVFAVAPVHFLDHALAAVAARQIEINVRPRRAPLAQEPLEEQLARDGIARGDAEAIAHHAVRRAAAALHEDALRFAVVHEIPDDEKVAAEPEPRDEPEFVFELRAFLRAGFSVAPARTVERHFAEKGIHRLALRHAVAREFVAEFFEREAEAFREAHGVRHGFRRIGKKTRHLRGGLEVPLVVQRQQAARCVEVRVVPSAGEDIEHRALVARRVKHAVRREQRESGRRCETAQRIVFPLLAAAEVTLDFHEDIPFSKRLHEP